MQPTKIQHKTIYSRRIGEKIAKNGQRQGVVGEQFALWLRDIRRNKNTRNKLP